MLRHKVENDWPYFIEAWKVDIYQKIPRMSLDFWYGTEGEMGLKEKNVRENIENNNRGQGKMMPKPIITEKIL